MFLKSSGEAYKLSMSSKPIEKKVLEEEEETVANLGICIMEVSQAVHSSCVASFFHISKESKHHLRNEKR